MKVHEAISCKRCGKCCLADMIAYIEQEDIDRWKREDRKDILHIIENEHAIWVGDHLISSRDGRYIYGCPYLKWEGDLCSCTIYETRPRVCRDYEPGSSELCPQWQTLKSG